MIPDPGYLRLFRAIVLDVWKSEHAKTRELARVTALRADELRNRLDRLDEAFIFEKAIAKDAYERQRDKVHEELALVELDLNDARVDEKDVDGVLAFAEYLLLNAGRVWQEAALTQRQQIQRAIFPNGLPFDGRQFGTAPTCLAFSNLRGNDGGTNGMASPPGFEPGFWP